MSKEGTNDAEPTASKSWPTEVPKVLQNVKIKLSADDKFITCFACATYDDRNASKNGVVFCARERIFKFDSMLDHVKHAYHSSSMSRLAIDDDGANLTAYQFYKKYGRMYTKRKTATKMADFFAPLPKKSKSDKATVDETVGIADMVDATVVAIDDLHETTSVHPLVDTPVVMPNITRKVCGGSFASCDQTNMSIQKGLQLTHDYYRKKDSSGVIKLIEGTTEVYSIFQNDCNGINIQ